MLSLRGQLTDPLDLYHQTTLVSSPRSSANPIPTSMSFSTTPTRMFLARSSPFSPAVPSVSLPLLSNDMVLSLTVPPSRLVGAALAGYTADKIGRKRTIQLGSLIALLGCGLQSGATNVSSSAIFTATHPSLTRPRGATDWHAHGRALHCWHGHRNALDDCPPLPSAFISLELHRRSTSLTCRLLGRDLSSPRPWHALRYAR